ncbi:hypothetical protein J5N97_002554 [Dioscorea zingiberensis]|uniref:Calmodulin-binding domain-containing protein n=1 Tax=Dioscorea zingiberensis TaxID=325984 RepID=A0A9D5HPK6_9LILI|nr:hypothetical protein J5N97_002554 [Dioscorea zingiberensis]
MEANMKACPSSLSILNATVRTLNGFIHKEMPTKLKEGSANQKPGSSSAPSTPRKSDSGKTKLVNSSDENSSDIVITPHYLKPTISSCNVAYKNVTKQPTENLVTTRGRHLPSRSFDKLPSQSHQPVKAPVKTPKSPTAPSPKPIITEKPSKPVSNIKPTKLSRVKSLPKGAISVSKRNEASGAALTNTKTKGELKERKLSVYTLKKEGVQQEQVDHPKTPEGATYANDEVKHHQAPSSKELSDRGPRKLVEKGGNSKWRPHEGKAMMGSGAVPTKMKFKEKEKVVVDGEEKEDESLAMKKGEVKLKESPKGNEVIEEAAKKLADRRNKVKALVGAFETVMSLQETEGQHSPQHAKEIVVNQMEDEGQQSQQQMKENTNVDAIKGNAAQQEEENKQEEKMGLNEVVVNVTTDKGQSDQHEEEQTKEKEELTNLIDNATEENSNGNNS